VGPGASVGSMNSIMTFVGGALVAVGERVIGDESGAVDRGFGLERGEQLDVAEPKRKGRRALTGRA
jgi:hypothetical protein